MASFIKFALVGCLNTGITIGTYSLLTYLNINYIIANVIGYSLGTLNSYIWNKNWVFKSKQEHKKVLFKFITVNLLTLGFNTLFLYLLVDKFNGSKFISQLLVTAVGLVINFSLNKIWTFKEENSNG